MVNADGWFTDAIWAKYDIITEEMGFDFYYSFERQEGLQTESASENNDNVLAFHSIMETFRDQFWRIKEQKDDEAMSQFLQNLSAAIHTTQNR
jgi:hypothetical protein